MKLKHSMLLIFVIVTVAILLKFEKVHMRIENSIFKAAIFGERTNNNAASTLRPAEMPAATTSALINETHGKNSPIISTAEGNTVITYGEK